ncbi:hypothetical protein GCM10009814_36150 [Lapillicoccus jejuensis]
MLPNPEEPVEPFELDELEDWSDEEDVVPPVVPDVVLEEVVPDEATVEALASEARCRPTPPATRVADSSTPAVQRRVLRRARGVAGMAGS